MEPDVQNCNLCGQSYPIWHCGELKGRPVQRRRETAKQQGLRYRCLCDDHLKNVSKSLAE